MIDMQRSIRFLLMGAGFFRIYCILYKKIDTIIEETRSRMEETKNGNRRQGITDTRIF